MKKAHFAIVAAISCLLLAPMAEAKNRLKGGEHLAPGESLQSKNGVHTLTCQVNGNLLLRILGGSHARWNSGTADRDITGCYMQGNGNFVLRAPNGDAVWMTGTQNNPGAYLVVGDNGNVAIVSAGGVRLWTTNTGL